MARKDLKQQHFCGYREGWQANVIAASGANLRMPQRDEKNARAMEEALDGCCEPSPPAQAFLSGIAHRNDRPDKAGQLWDVVRALASKKVHYRPLLSKAVRDAGAASGAPFCEAYPDAVLGDGWTAHILHKHDGEVRENQHRAFWHDQFAKTSDVRRWLYWYHENQSEGNLFLTDIS